MFICQFHGLRDQSTGQLCANSGKTQLFSVHNSGFAKYQAAIGMALSAFIAIDRPD
jgi:hypothetical protein